MSHRTEPAAGMQFHLCPNRVVLSAQVPESVNEDPYMLFRHDGNLPFAGLKAGDTFYVLWIESRFGDLYDHG